MLSEFWVYLTTFDVMFLILPTTTSTTSTSTATNLTINTISLLNKTTQTTPISHHRIKTSFRRLIHSQSNTTIPPSTSTSLQSKIKPSHHNNFKTTEPQPQPHSPHSRLSNLIKLGPILFDPLRIPRYPIVLCHGLYG